MAEPAFFLGRPGGPKWMKKFQIPEKTASSYKNILDSNLLPQPSKLRSTNYREFGGSIIFFLGGGAVAHLFFFLCFEHARRHMLLARHYKPKVSVARGAPTRTGAGGVNVCNREVAGGNGREEAQLANAYPSFPRYPREGFIRRRRGKHSLRMNKFQNETENRKQKFRVHPNRVHENKRGWDKTD